MQVVDALAVALVIVAGGAFWLGEGALSRADDLRALYWLVVGVVALRAATQIARPGGADVNAARRRRPALPEAARDQHESPFATILADLVARAPGAKGAALVDLDGEAVDYSGRISPFEIKVAAAHFRIVLHDLRRSGPLADASFLAVRAARASFVVQALPDAYALVIVFARSAGFAGWQRAVAVCARSLAAEAGWSWEAGPPRWFAVDVGCDERRRPRALQIDGEARPFEVLGAIVDAARTRERSWRVRLASGLEATLVREPSGFWYLDDHESPSESPAGKSR